MPVLMVSIFTMSGIGVPFSRSVGEQHVVLVDHFRPSAVASTRGGGLVAFEGFLPDVVTVRLRGNGEHGEKHGAHAVRVLDSGPRVTPTALDPTDSTIHIAPTFPELSEIEATKPGAMGGGDSRQAQWSRSARCRLGWP